MSRYVILCGGRDHPPFTLREILWLDTLHATNPLTALVVGSHAGADLYGHEWAQLRGITTLTFWANWGTYGKYGGPERNTRMLYYDCSQVEKHHDTTACIIAFAGGRGTADMYRQDRKAGAEVIAWPHTP